MAEQVKGIKLANKIETTISSMKMNVQQGNLFERLTLIQVPEILHSEKKVQFQKIQNP